MATLALQAVMQGSVPSFITVLQPDALLDCLARYFCVARSSFAASFYGVRVITCICHQCCLYTSLLHTAESLGPVQSVLDARLLQPELWALRHLLY